MEDGLFHLRNSRVKGLKLSVITTPMMPVENAILSLHIGVKTYVMLI